MLFCIFEYPSYSFIAVWKIMKKAMNCLAFNPLDTKKLWKTFDISVVWGSNGHWKKNTPFPTKFAIVFSTEEKVHRLLAIINFCCTKIFLLSPRWIAENNTNCLSPQNNVYECVRMWQLDFFFSPLSASAALAFQHFLVFNNKKLKQFVVLKNYSRITFML